jgi:hypothetical protein
LRASDGEDVPKQRGADALALRRGLHEEHRDLRGVSAVVRWVSVCGRRLDRAEAGHLVSARATSHNRQRAPIQIEPVHDQFCERTADEHQGAALAVDN